MNFLPKNIFLRNKGVKANLMLAYDYGFGNTIS